MTSTQATLKFSDNSTKTINANEKITKLLTDAKSFQKNTVTANIAEGDAAKTSDDKYYQSTLITVVGSPSHNFENYKVELSGIDGAIIVDENGQELNKDNIAAGTNFYVRIPAEKVTTESQTVKVNVTANFTGNSVSFYKTGDDKLQRMASIFPGSEIAGAEFAVVGNTGMNVAQTIYFVGLIVLLCGVGIVYANAKPVQEKQ
jgi:hypothetical protein